MPSEPDLVAWEPELRTRLDKLRKQGVVAVRYEARGCDIELELLPDCFGPKNKYAYSAFKANETKVAHDLHELVTTTPVGASNVAGIVKDKGELRTDLEIVGRIGLPAGSTVTDVDLVGPECKRATHVISALFVGGFAMGPTHEGDPRICQRAAAEGIELGGCSVPIRAALTEIGGRNLTPIAVVPKSATRAVEPLPEGVFDQTSVERVIRVHLGKVKRACWGTPNGLKRIKVEVATTINRGGVVSSAEPRVVEAEGSVDAASRVARCIGEEVRGWRFPDPETEQQVALPFHLMGQ